jgi:hypothetical protein
MAVPMPGNGILAITRRTFVALARQGAGQLLFQNGFDKAADPSPDSVFEGVKPVVEKYGFGRRISRICGSVAHGVVSRSALERFAFNLVHILHF